MFKFWREPLKGQIPKVIFISPAVFVRGKASYGVLLLYNLS